MMAIDIIIPVYNGYEVLADCLESVRRHASPVDRVVIIDDASPDSRVWPLLQRYAELPGFLLLRNEQNMGFVGTVNQGMQLDPERDVILLNSDTIVTSGWVEKMARCAASEPNVASVTALSNNATICSVPVWMENNALPAGHTIDSYAAFVEEVSLRLYPEIPTAVGFCMYIRRAALVAIGLFDAEAFAKGYGEENDWCMRALDAGWIHLCDDATYIYHQGSVSFGAMKDGHVAINSAVLLRRHPSYQDIIDDFIHSNSLALIQKNLQVASCDRNARPAVLFVLHNPIDSIYIGGTEFHVANLVDELNDRFRTYVAYVNEGIFRVDEFNFDESGESSKLSYAFSLEAGYGEAFDHVLELFKIELVHVHHMLSHSLEDLFASLKKFSGPKVVSIHDYVTVCRNFNLLYKQQHFCKLTRNDFTCTSCIRDTTGWTMEQLKAYRRVYHDGLAIFDRIYFPSESVRDHIVDYHQLDLAKTKVVPHGLEVAPTTHTPTYRGGTFRIAFIGTLVLIKGVDSIARLIAENAIAEIEWHLFGTPELTLPQPVFGRMIYHGAYDRMQIVQILAKHEIHLGLLPSLCPETFSFTLSEFYLAKIPVVGSTLGAIGERIARDRTGWIMTPDDIPGILNLLAQLQANPAMLNAVHDRADFSVPTVGEMSTWYGADYESFLASTPIAGEGTPSHE